MTIRTKIFLLAGVLLALFGFVVGALAYVQKRDDDRLSNITRYEQPLRGLIAEFDVDTDGYELIVQRALNSDHKDPKELERATSSAHEVSERMLATVARCNELLTAATQDPEYQAEDRVDLAEMAGSLQYLSRGLDEFINVGEITLAALAAGKFDDARTASHGFDKFAEAYGPDLAKIRRQLAVLTDRATRTVLERQHLNTRLSFALFLAACGVGLGISAIGSVQVVAGLRQLLASTRAIEAGAKVEPVIIRTRDEVGELARSFNRMIEELRTRDRIKETFGKFIDPRIVTRLLGSEAEQAERRTLTVFFSDIKKFSGISEQLTASAVVHLLNNYFGTVAHVIREHHGVIDKFIGDAVMAFWVPPFSTGDDHASDACRAALAQQKAVAALRSRLPEITGMRKNTPELVVRMGIATGEAVVGTIGSESARSYTAMGDTVNLASRLEGINKAYGTSVIIADETYRLAQTAIEARELDTVVVAGKSEPIRIYELMACIGELTEQQVAMRGSFGNGLAAYRERDWDAAEAAFTRCLQTIADDAPSAVFLDRIRVLRANPPPPDWDGVWRFSEK